MKNALFVIQPYRWNGLWVFDDPRVGLDKEPFVAGVPEMIDRLVSDIPDAGNGFLLLFSEHPFPGAMVELEWVREEYSGHWYHWTTTGMEGWLCPALFRYFERPPSQLFAQAKPRSPAETG